MCGIAGFISTGRDDGENAALLAQMTGALRRRGPDDENFLVLPGPGSDQGRRNQERKIHFGFRRLAIIDVVGGRQPMETPEGDAAIVFNGEIYNAPDLRPELAAAGRRFATGHSDTEALLQGYCVWGDGVLQRLNGMFAFCVYDRRAGRLFLARDRFGKKPLYYAQTPEGGFVFASELSALLRHPDVDRTVDPAAVAKYFAYGYVPAPLTLRRGVRKLPAGCAMTVDVATGAIEVRRYWEYRPGVAEPPPGGPDDWAAELRELLSAAVRRRLVSDVPLGFFLSGGVDSTAVAALAARLGDPAAMQTFTIGFTEPSYDESAYAAATAQTIGTAHHCKTLDYDQASALIPDLLRRVDDPIADASLLPTWLLSDFTRQSVTVALSGDGADELFAGYDTFSALRLAQIYDRLTPRPLHRLAERIAHALPRSENNMSFDFKLRRALRGLGLSAPHWAPAWLGPAAPDEIAALTGSTATAAELYGEAADLWAERRADSLKTGAKTGIVDQSLAFYARFYLQDGILTKVDRASMLCSLEARSPFLDRDVAAFAERLPAWTKLNGGKRKWLLKKALTGVVPDAVLNRKKKGFGIPLAQWLRQLPPPPAAASDRLGLNVDWLNAKWAEHRDGRADHRGLLWAWTALAYAEDGAEAPAD